MTDLQDALDGLQDAEEYAEEIGAVKLAAEIAERYQRLATLSPSEDWEELE